MILAATVVMTRCLFVSQILLAVIPARLFDIHDSIFAVHAASAMAYYPNDLRIQKLVFTDRSGNYGRLGADTIVTQYPGYRPKAAYSNQTLLVLTSHSLGSLSSSESGLNLRYLDARVIPQLPFESEFHHEQKRWPLDMMSYHATRLHGLFSPYPQGVGVDCAGVGDDLAMRIDVSICGRSQAFVHKLDGNRMKVFSVSPKEPNRDDGKLPITPSPFKLIASYPWTSGPYFTVLRCSSTVCYSIDLSGTLRMHTRMLNQDLSLPIHKLVQPIKILYQDDRIRIMNRQATYTLHCDTIVRTVTLGD